MAKKPAKSRATALTISTLPPAVLPGTPVVPEAAYRNDRHPTGSGPWSGEPDKFAWTDEATGYPCVVVRERTGEYGAHVGVPPEHPLSGYAAQAIPGEISSDLHRPVSCAQPCQRSVSEPLSICHVSERRRHVARQVAAHQVAKPGEQADDAWWLGMIFDGPRDFVPAGGKRALAAERGETYRDARFAFEQATLLARRLRDYGLLQAGKRGAGRQPIGLPGSGEENGR